MSTPNGDQSIEEKMDMSLVSERYQQDPWFLESELSYGRNNLSALLMLWICPYLSAEKHRLLGQYFPVV